MELTPEQAIKNGAEWLDKVYPEWWSRVDLGKLNMDDSVACICGQVFGYGTEVGIPNDLNYFYTGWQAYLSDMKETCWVGFLAITEVAARAGLDDEKWSDEHGFSGYDEVYNPLWDAEIKCRADIGLVD